MISLKLNFMKIFNKIVNKGIMCLVFALIASSFVSCDDSIIDQIAEKRVVLSTLQINSTPELPLLVGKDSLLSITYAPEAPTNPALAWKSDNEAVATVSQEGKVSAIAVGSAVVTVSSTDGSARKHSVTIKVIDKIEFITDIALTSGSQEIFQGETLAITATVAPANATYKTIKWTSSNSSVATVSQSGLVTGVAKGNVVITAASTDGSGKSKTIALTVKEVIPITDVAISTVASETLAIGEQFPIAVVLTPANATAQSLVWSSNNEAVASVSAGGVITAISDGQATISVAAKNNSNIRASITVVVEAGKINDTFFGATTPWQAVTANSTGVIENGKFKVTMAAGTKYRGDFKRAGGATLHAGNFPIIAFKFNRTLGTGNVVFDTNNGSYLNGNNKLHTLIAKDGVQVHYANLATGTFGGSAVKLSTTATTTLSTFQLKVADFVLTADQIAAGGYKYEVHWVKSFKSLADLEAYINR